MVSLRHALISILVMFTEAMEDLHALNRQLDIEEESQSASTRGPPKSESKMQFVRTVGKMAGVLKVRMWQV